jgi:hypothetical protein
MLKNVVTGLVVIMLFSCSSCLEILEKVVFNKDGSGTYEMTMDMSGLFEMMASFGMDLDDLAGEEEGEEMADDDESNFEAMDTTIYFADMSSELKALWQYPDVSKNGWMKVNFNEDESKALFSFGLNFNEISNWQQFSRDLPTAFAAMDDMEFSPEDMDMGSEDITQMFSGPSEFLWKKGEFSRTKSLEGQDEDLLDDEEMAMFEMFMSGAYYTVEYHMPGKVKKVSESSYEIDDKVVRKKIPMMDLMKQDDHLGVVIKYK